MLFKQSSRYWLYFLLEHTLGLASVLYHEITHYIVDVVGFFIGANTWPTMELSPASITTNKDDKNKRYLSGWTGKVGARYRRDQRGRFFLLLTSIAPLLSTVALLSSLYVYEQYFLLGLFVSKIERLLPSPTDLKFAKKALLNDY